MKKLLVLAAVAGMLVLSACTGVRGYDGNQKVCRNNYFLGISIIEQISPCSK